MAKRYVYNKKDFCVPVTKTEPREAVQFIIDEFINKKISFIVSGDAEDCEIWRLVEEGDSEKIKKTGVPARPAELYIDGKLVEDFDMAD